MAKWKGKKVKKAHFNQLKRHKEFLDYVENKYPKIRKVWNS